MSGRTANRLTKPQHDRLKLLVGALAVNGRAHATDSQAAITAEQALGFKVTEGNVGGARRELNIAAARKADVGGCRLSKDTREQISTWILEHSREGVAEMGDAEASRQLNAALGLTVGARVIGRARESMGILLPHRPSPEPTRPAVVVRVPAEEPPAREPLVLSGSPGGLADLLARWDEQSRRLARIGREITAHLERSLGR